MKVSKGAKIRNRYNQVPHLTQDTNGKVTNAQFDTTNESQEVSPFTAGDHKAHILNSKRNAYYSISNKYQKPSSKFTLNYMNIFDQTGAFILDHFICHYTVNYYVLLTDAKMQKPVPYIGRAMF